jgi:hypothetical protein
MKRKILAWLYKRYENLFADIIIIEYFGNIPRDVNVPALDFMANNRTVLEKFFSIQAYNLTRKAIGSGKNVEFYNGALMIIKAFVLGMNRTRGVKVDPITEKAEVNPLDGVNDFLSAIKNEK